MSESAAPSPTVATPAVPSTAPGAAPATAPADNIPAVDVPAGSILPLALNITVQNCCNAYNKAFVAERFKGSKEYDARHKAIEAYRNAMPHLTSHTNIRAFIACVAHGMLIEILRNDDGSKLLYAAQIALIALPREPKSAGRPRSESC